jgi:hypothetical protein
VTSDLGTCFLPFTIPHPSQSNGKNFMQSPIYVWTHISVHKTIIEDNKHVCNHQTNYITTSHQPVHPHRPLLKLPWLYFYKACSYTVTVRFYILWWNYESLLLFGHVITYNLFILVKPSVLLSSCFWKT